MSDMRVKMILDLVSNAKGAAEAKRGLRDVKTAAQDLNRTEAGRRITRDFLSIASTSKGAARGAREVKAAAAGIGSDGGAAKLARDLDSARAAAKRLRSEMAGLKKQTAIETGGRVPGGVPSTEGGTNLFPGTRAMLGGYLGIQGARAGVRGTVGQAVSFEKAMADVMKKVDLPEGQTQADLERMVTGSAIKFGRSREQIAGLAAELGAAGVAYKDLGQAIALATKSSVAWDMIPSETGEKLAKIRTQHNKTLEELEVFGDKVNALADSGASKERSIVEMFQRAAAGAKVADVDEDTSLAFMTAMNAGGMADEVAARGFGAMVSKLRTAKSTANKKMAEGLKMLGLTPAGVEKGIKTNSLATMLDLMDRFSKSSDKAAVAVKMFGQEWWDEFARMVQSAPEIAKNLKLLSDPKNYLGSMDKSLAIDLATTANHLERLKALASDVGDRLSRWALPGINEAIERLIKGLETIDARDSERKQRDDLAKKQVSGQALTPEERDKLTNDASLAASVNRRKNEITAQEDYAETSGRIAGSDNTGDALSERAQLLRRQLQRQINSLQTELKLTPGTASPGKRKRLEALQRQLVEIPTSPADKRIKAVDPRRPADQAERGRADRGEVQALRERVQVLQGRLAAIVALKETASIADKPGYRADAAAVDGKLARARRDFSNLLAPNATAAGRFGLAGGGSVQGEGKEGAKPGAGAPKAAAPATGPGLLSFGLRGAAGLTDAGWKKGSGAAWAAQIRSELDIDLGDAGVTLMERFRSGIESGGAGAAAAAGGAKDGVLAALQGGDATAAGLQLAASFAAGITAGTPAAVAAARGAKAQVDGVLGSGSGSGGRRAVSGALHDGVD